MSLLSAAKVERDYVSNFLVSLWEEKYSFEAVTFKNTTGSTISGISPGEMLDYSGGFYVLTTVANTAVAILANAALIPALANNATITVLAMVRGPAIVNSTALTVQSAATKATCLASLVTNMSPYVKFITEPTVVQVGPLL